MVYNETVDIKKYYSLRIPDETERNLPHIRNRI